MPNPERPIIRPGYVVLRRAARPGTTSIQFGLHPDHAVRFDVQARSCDAVLAGLDGSLTTDQVVDRAVAHGADAEVAHALLVRLRDARVLVDAGTWLDWTRTWDDAERGRRLPDLHAWDRYADAAAVTARRAGAVVRVHGAGRVGAALVLLLAAAGVGRLVVVDTAVVGPADLTPFGYQRDQLGRRRAHALRDLVHRTSTATTLTGAAGPADVVVLCPDTGEADRDQIADLVRDSLPHLLVRTRDGAGSVGPFVVPGRTACVRCTDLHRTDRDRDWPALLSQLIAAGAAVPDTVLAAQLAAVGAAQVLQWLAGEDPATAGRSVEIELVGEPARTLDWPPHPYCGCRWPDQLGEADDDPLDQALHLR